MTNLKDPRRVPDGARRHSSPAKPVRATATPWAQNPPDSSPLVSFLIAGAGILGILWAQAVQHSCWTNRFTRPSWQEPMSRRHPHSSDFKTYLSKLSISLPSRTCTPRTCGEIPSTLPFTMVYQNHQEEPPKNSFPLEVYSQGFTSFLFTFFFKP